MLIFELAEIIISRERIISFLSERGLIKNTILCSQCPTRTMAMQNSSREKNGKIFRCSNCKSTKSIRTNTIFKKSKLDLKIIVSIIYLSSADVLQKTMSEMVGISEKTVSEFTNIIREEYSASFNRQDERLGGTGVYVQVILTLILII